MANNESEQRVRVSLSLRAWNHWRSMDADRTRASVFSGLIDAGLAVEEAGLSGPLLTKAIDTGSLALLSLLLAPRVAQEVKMVAVMELLANAEIDSNIFATARLPALSPVTTETDLSVDSAVMDEPEFEEMPAVSVTGLGNF